MSRQKHKGKKRPRSWHRRRHPGNSLPLAALERKLRRQARHARSEPASNKPEPEPEGRRP